ncbi:MAG TPA: hypothetical protein VMS93_04245 [Candidatus Saccharimonadales bacterium]|nr:hypothetical protein [Candidatus Saccharimonadales bacterium]
MFDASTIGVLVPIFALAIPIVAIVGGIASQISKTMARTRVQELLIQERLKAIEKGMTPPPPGPILDPGADDRGQAQMALAGAYDPGFYRRQRVFGLRLGGAITLAVGAAIGFALYYGEHETAWVWMTIPMAIGACLIIASFFVPDGASPAPGGPPRPAP